MTQEERIAVTSAPSDPDKVSKIISILRKKADKDFVKFCAILEMSGNKHWATCLRGTDQLSVPKSEFRQKETYCRIYYHERELMRCFHPLSSSFSKKQLHACMYNISIYK